MKKTLKILLVLLMLCAVTLTLVGCGDKEETNKNGKVENVENNRDDNDENTTKFDRGEWDGDQYINNFADIKFNLPEGWEKASDEDIAKLMNVGNEFLNEDQQKFAELAEQTTVYGMVVNDPSTSASVMITIEKPILKVTPENYLTSVKQQLEMVEAMKYVVGEQYTTEIAGDEYYSIDAEVPAYSVYQSYFVKEVDDYIVGIIITTATEAQKEEITDYFE